MISSLIDGVNELLLNPDNCLFVDPLPKYFHLKCPICLKTLLPEPYLASCCGHHFCDKCVKLLHNKQCPLCKSRYIPDSRVIDKGQQRAINSLRVYCPNKDKSCEWVGEFGILENHLSTCSHIYVICSFNCGSSCIFRKDVTIHESEKCPLRPSTCKHCNMFSGTYDQVSNHEHRRCQKAEINCKHGCGTIFLREKQSQHLQQCNLVPVKCTFDFAGCTWLGSKRSQDEHLEKMWKKHISLVSLYTARETIKNHEDKILSLTKPLNKQEASIQKLTKEINAVRKSISISNMSDSPSQAIAGHNTVVELPSIPPRTNAFIFVIDRYSHKKSFPWHSPLLNDNSGCSMQLTVYLNGFNEAQGSYVSVYVSFPGSLPFIGAKMMIRLCSQNPKYNHHERIIVFDSSVKMDKFKLLSGSLGRRTGFDTFIKQDSLQPYLKNDSLVFELPHII